MKQEAVEFEAGGLKLRGRLFQPDVPKPLAVLFLHGWTGYPNYNAAKFIAEHGYPALAFNLSGHHDSEGRIEDQTRDKSLKEVLAAYDLFAGKLPAGTKIAAAGNSYGGYLAALLPSVRQLSAIQLRVPANYPDEDSDKKQVDMEREWLKKWRQYQTNPSENRTLAAVNSFGGPIQIIEAENDAEVSHQTVQNFIDSIKDKKQLDYHLMKGWPHSLGDDPGRNEQYQKILLGWLDSISEL